MLPPSSKSPYCDSSLCSNPCHSSKSSSTWTVLTSWTTDWPNWFRNLNMHICSIDQKIEKWPIHIQIYMQIYSAWELADSNLSTIPSMRNGHHRALKITNYLESDHPRRPCSPPCPVVCGSSLPPALASAERRDPNTWERERKAERKRGRWQPWLRPTNLCCWDRVGGCGRPPAA
jgi:hypothetical protein